MLVAARYWQGDECVSSPSRRVERTGLRGGLEPERCKDVLSHRRASPPPRAPYCDSPVYVGQLARALRKPNCPGSVKHPQT